MHLIDAQVYAASQACIKSCSGVITVCTSKEEREQRQREQEKQQRRNQIQASPALPLKMEAPIQCDVDAYEAQTVKELLAQLTVMIGLEEADVIKLSLEFAGEVMQEGERTLWEIGMCPQAAFAVLGVEETKAARKEAMTYD